MGKRHTEGKRPVNKKTKTSITFDPSARKDFLTGFRRRKQERRKKAAEKMERQLKEEVKNAKEKAKERAAASYGKTSKSDRPLPEVAHILRNDDDEDDDEVAEGVSEVVDMGTHTVAVTHLTDGLKKKKSKSDPEKEEEEEDNDDTKEEKQKGGLTKSEQRTVNYLVQKQVQGSKAFRRQQHIKSAKEGKKSKFAKKKTKSKRDKHFNPMKNTGRK